MFGFVVLSHRGPGQLRRLTKTISKLYGDPPIACHHDFSQAALDPADFPRNVHFVERYVRTGWGKWSLVDATLRALDLLYQGADPDYFLSISAADYPVARPDEVLADFEQLPSDAWIDSFNLERAILGEIPQGEPELAFHRSPQNIALASRLFLQEKLRVPVIRVRKTSAKSGEPLFRLGRDTHALPFRALRSPFDTNYHCFVGSQWFSGRRKAAHKLLNPSSKDRQLARYLSTRPLPDGCYFQTTLCNDTSITWQDRTFRLALWNGGGAHPMDLGEEHLSRLLAEKPHFARKFVDDSPVLDQIDRHLGIS